MSFISEFSDIDNTSLFIFLLLIFSIRLSFALYIIETDNSLNKGGFESSFNTCFSFFPNLLFEVCMRK